jgi:glycerophosphoryl diester phosphodiesterase
MAEPRFSDFPSATLVGHRGDPRRHPENSISGFVAAIEAGADAVELDVRLTADGVPIVLHDADVGRTTGGRGLVHDLQLEEVRGLRLAGDGGEGVPTLGEAVRAVDAAGGGLDIEIKNLPGDPAYEPDRERALEGSLAELDASRFSGPVVISSFNPSTIRRCRALAPGVATGLLVIDAVEPRHALDAADVDGHTFVLPSVGSLAKAGRSLIEDAHERGVRVGAWNADDEATVRWLLEWEADAIATNDPAMAASARSRWRAERS